MVAMLENPNSSLSLNFRKERVAFPKSLMFFLLLAATQIISGCKYIDAELEASASNEESSPPTAAAPTNPPAAPTPAAASTLSLSGSPSASLVEGEYLAFLPETTYDGTLPLSYSIENRPDWLLFDSNTGELWGLAGNTAAGIYSEITISVTDGTLVHTLAPFQIEVINKSTLQLSWHANYEPDLAGYVIYFGTDLNELTESIETEPDSPGYLMEVTGSGDFYFAVSAKDFSGNESSASEPVFVSL